MPRPYSLDLRERVVAVVASGMSRRAAAAHFQVSESVAIRWTKRAEQTGSPAALPLGGKKPFTLAEHGEWIHARLAEKPDITGRELLAELHERGVEVSYYGVWHFLDHEGLSYKKTLHASEQDRPDVAHRRAQWKQHQGKIDPKRLIFIDETWAKTNMTRQYGRCAVGKRLVRYPDELMVMRDDQQVMFVENLDPIPGKKIVWYAIGACMQGLGLRSGPAGLSWRHENR